LQRIPPGIQLGRRISRARGDAGYDGTMDFHHDDGMDDNIYTTLLVLGEGFVIKKWTMSFQV
jgi:hypothetical protein